MATVSDLLKFKKEITLIDPENKVELRKVWVRILGDESLKEAYKHARIASSKRRSALRDKDSVDHQDAVAQLDDATTETLMVIVAASRSQDFAAEASVIVVREDLPTLEELSSRPDAPSLEDQERLDIAIKEADERYQKALDEFVSDKEASLKVELAELSYEDLRDLTVKELANVQAMEAFVLELNDQKGYRGTFEDEECKIRSYADILDFKESHSQIKGQIIEAYESLELKDEEIKN